MLIIGVTFLESAFTVIFLFASPKFDLVIRNHVDGNDPFRENIVGAGSMMMVHLLNVDRIWYMDER